ncbi:MAG: S41 family peptidase [Bacillota bacterium]
MRKRSFSYRAVLLTLFALLLAGLLSGCSPNWQDLTTEQKLEDFNFLFGILKDNHPYLALKARNEGYDWLSHEGEFEQAIRESADDASFAQAIAWMLRQVNNGHTNVLPAASVQSTAGWNEKPWKDVARLTSEARMNYWYSLCYPPASVASQGKYPPFLAIYNGGQYVVVRVAPEQAIQSYVQVGMTVLRVEDRPVREYVAAQRGSVHPYRVLYDPTQKCLYQRELVLPTEEESLSVTLRDAQGAVIEAQVPYASRTWDATYPWPPKYADPGSPTPNLYTDILAGGNVGYIRIASLLDRTEAPVLRRFFESIRHLPALIIDIRGNGGGLSSYWEQDIVGQLTPGPVDCDFYLTWRSGDYVQPFVQAKMALMPLKVLSKTALVEKAGSGLAGNIPPEVMTGDFVNPRVLTVGATPRDSVNYRGRIFLLVDDRSYSAAEGFTAFCKASGFATVVGTWTGGDGIGFTPAEVVLPNSGMVVRFPLGMGLNPDFTANEESHTLPHVFVEQNLDDILVYMSKWASGAVSQPDPTYDAALRRCLELASGD